jgi:hypothetical protein
MSVSFGVSRFAGGWSLSLGGLFKVLATTAIADSGGVKFSGLIRW